MRDMTKGSEFRHILAFSLPLFIGNVLQQLYFFIDSIIIGRFRGPDAFAAVNAATPVLFLMIALVMGLTMGATIMISQFFGAKDEERLRRTYATSMIFYLGAAVVVTVVGLLISKPLLVLLGTPDEILPGALSFLTVSFAGITGMILYNSFAAFLRGVGDSKTPLFFLAISTALNIALDFLFIPGLGMGPEGVALATVIAQTVSGLLCLRYINRKVPILRLTRKDLVFDGKLFATSIRVGLPMAIQQSVLGLSGLAVQGLVNSFGMVTITAYGAALRIDQIATAFILSIGMSTTTFTGQNVGAGRFDRVGKGLRASLVLMVLICLAITGIVLLFGEQLIALFVGAGDVAVLQQGGEYLRVVSFFYVVFGLMFCMNGVLRGAGDVLVPLYTTIATLLTRVIAAYVLSAVATIGYRGIWWSIPVSWVLASMISSTRYFSGAWKKKALTAGQRRGAAANAATEVILEEECLP
jgi:putative MATE family efflux protein